MKLFSLKNMVLGLTMVILASTTPVFAKHKKRCHRQRHAKPVEVVVVDNCCNSCEPPTVCQPFTFSDKCCPSNEVVHGLEMPLDLAYLKIQDDTDAVISFVGGYFNAAGSSNPPPAIVLVELATIVTSLDESIDEIRRCIEAFLLKKHFSAVQAAESSSKLTRDLKTVLERLNALVVADYIDPTNAGGVITQAYSLFQIAVNQLIEDYVAISPAPCAERLRAIGALLAPAWQNYILSQDQIPPYTILTAQSYQNNITGYLLEINEIFTDGVYFDICKPKDCHSCNSCRR